VSRAGEAYLASVKPRVQTPVPPKKIIVTKKNPIDVFIKFRGCIC
jgi:hypothetical protein